MAMYLPRFLPPACPEGYTWKQIEQVFPPSVFLVFQNWMRGQTGMICDGRSYDYDAKAYVPTECADHPHGMVIYIHDVERFIRQHPITD